MENVTNAEKLDTKPTSVRRKSVENSTGSVMDVAKQVINWKTAGKMRRIKRKDPNGIRQAKKKG